MYSRGSKPPPPSWTRTSFAAAPPKTCAGFHWNGSECTARVGGSDFCDLHAKQGMWTDRRTWCISAGERYEHAQDRRCSGLTQKWALCRNRIAAGSFRYCHLHGNQQLPTGLPVSSAPEYESPMRSVVRARAREFDWLKERAEGGDYEEMRRQQRRRAQEREEYERAQRERERERRDWEQQQQQQQQSRSHARESAQDQQQGRAGQQESANRAPRVDEARARPTPSQPSGSDLVKQFLEKSAIFDMTCFSTQNPNSFARIPWPVVPRGSAPIRPQDVSAENVRAFCLLLATVHQQRHSTDRQLRLAMKQLTARFHSDRFNERRTTVSTIRDLNERALVLAAADVVVKTVNVFRG
ncbi:hypothetical protein HMN09_00386500 [Mycena chlorophos]|uniref:Uncharacterized protein n=1 Tax=Mycena chlorophos TaxID=658473 RepID=A0A8H6TL92_MYCCL|nr:hypothetical protein HMN09_00386500 [Mycena chlorophos]